MGDEKKNVLKKASDHTTIDFLFVPFPRSRKPIEGKSVIQLTADAALYRIHMELWGSEP